MAIAALKAALVVAYFTHVRYGERLTRVFAAAVFVGLGMKATVVIIEVATR